jgi:hypothetical protein
MKAKTRRKLEMGARALDFSRTHPDPSPGYAAAMAHLEDCVTQGRQLADLQREGLLQARAATARKRDLCRTLRRAHLAHLIRVARMAARDLPELRAKFELRRGTIPYLTFRTIARRMAAEAESRKDVMVRHGLADTVLQSLTQSLQELDRAVEQGIAGRRLHIGASAGLDETADEVVQIVKAMDALNRFRFEKEPGLLAEWASVSNVIATPRSSAAESAAPAAGDVRPAA